MSSTTANVNDIMDDDEGGLSGFSILAILAALLMVFCLVVYYAYRQGKASALADSEQLPVVAADPRPVAEDVPATATADSGRQEIYDRVTGAVETRIVTQEDPSRDALDGYGGAPAKLTQRQEPLSVRNEPEDPVVTAMTRSPSENTAASAPVRKPETTDTSPAAPAMAEAKPVAAKPAPSKTTQTASAAPAESSSAGALTGSHVVQVGAFDSNSAALDYFDGLAGKMGSFVASKKPDIQEATVKGRTYHRLRIGPFTTKSEANSYCSQLKTKGQDCLVRGV
jgi:cell division protein FtsN